jgi:predicted hydrocarbon binding protein
MKRSEFLKACASGVCGCGLLSMLAPGAARAEEKKDQAAAAPADCEQAKQELDGARERFALLVTAMGAQLDDATRQKLLQQTGRECARRWIPFFEKHRGDLPGFLAKARSAWLERADYDEKAGVLRVAGKPGPCACPLVKAGRTPADFCRCSTGWNELAFSTVVGRPVKVELEESVLRGDPRCSFRITIA